MNVSHWKKKNCPLIEKEKRIKLFLKGRALLYFVDQIVFSYDINRRVGGSITVWLKINLFLAVRVYFHLLGKKRRICEALVRNFDLKKEKFQIFVYFRVSDLFFFVFPSRCVSVCVWE